MTPFEIVAIIMALVTLAFWHGHRQGKEEGRLDGIEYCLIFMSERGWLTEEGLEDMEDINDGL
jgi:hypothetical protein